MTHQKLHTRKKDNRTKNLPSFPAIPPVRDTIKPGDNFYKHVNANWIHHVHMPPFISSYGVSEEIEASIDKKLFSIIKDSHIKVKSNSSIELPKSTRLIGTLAESALNTPTQKNSIKFVKSMISSFNCMRDIDDVSSVLGEFVKFKIKSLLTVFTSPMESKSKDLRLTFTVGELGLPDSQYYLEKSSKNIKILVQYKNLLKKIGDDMNIVDIDSIISLEHMAAKELKVSQADDELLMTGDEIEKNYPNISWTKFVKTAFNWSEEKWKSEKILVLSSHWLKSLNYWFSTLTIVQLKTWLMTSFALYVLPILPPPYDNWHFDLFQKKLRDQTEKTPQYQLTLNLTKQWLHNSLGERFIHEFVSPSIKSDAITLAKEIQTIAIERLKLTSWLEPSTRTKAVKKISSTYLGIGYPSRFKKTSFDNISPNNLVLNILTLGSEESKKDLATMNTELKIKEWDDSVFAVNAYYYNEGNRLIIPAGILQWPFFHIGASDGWNFGGIGATIGHELTHSFDIDGKDYDIHGNLHPWWTPNDNKHYTTITKQLIKLYTNTSQLDQHINGTLTLSENIADLGGLAISLAALKKRLDTKKVSNETRKKELTDFFKSYAVSWRTKEKKEKALQSLFMDVHAPPEFRVNNIVCQFDDWYECFDVKVGDTLFKAPNERIRIF
jgi:putative endopeptidase